VGIIRSRDIAAAADHTNLGGSYNVNRLRYLPRQDSGFGSLNGNILTYRTADEILTIDSTGTLVMEKNQFGSATHPNSRVLLDVRGKASGTKLKEPGSGQLFVVP
jgi:hypothetical protein